MKKRILSIIFCIMLILSQLALTTISSFAEEEENPELSQEEEIALGKKMIEKVVLDVTPPTPGATTEASPVVVIKTTKNEDGTETEIDPGFTISSAYWVDEEGVIISDPIEFVEGNTYKFQVEMTTDDTHFWKEADGGTELVVKHAESENGIYAINRKNASWATTTLSVVSKVPSEDEEGEEGDEEFTVVSDPAQAQPEEGQEGGTEESTGEQPAEKPAEQPPAEQQPAEQTPAEQPPAEDMNVSAAIEPEPAPAETVTVSVTTNKDGNFSIADGQRNESAAGDMDVDKHLDFVAAKNAAITLTATPHEGYVFAGWYTASVDEAGNIIGRTDTLLSSEAAFSFTADIDTKIYGKFNPDLPEYTVDILPGESPTTEIPDMHVTRFEGETYTLPPATTYDAPEGKQFDHWDVNGEAKNEMEEITITANTTITAIFTDIQMETVTLRIHESSIDGVDQVAPIEFQIAKGMTYRAALESAGHTPEQGDLFVLDGYGRGAVTFQTYAPLTSFASWADVDASAVAEDTVINEDTDVYCLMFKKINPAIWMASPTCGTTTSKPEGESEWDSLTNAPIVEIDESAIGYRAYQGHTNTAIWVTGPDTEELYTGELLGGHNACAYVWLSIDPGYYVDANGTVDVTNGEFQKIIKTQKDGFGFTVNVNVEHEAGEPVIETTKEATCEEGGSFDTVVYCVNHDRCGGELSRETTTTEPLTHSWGEWKTTKAAAPGVAGEEVRTCSKCNKTESRQTDPLPATQPSVNPGYVDPGTSGGGTAPAPSNPSTPAAAEWDEGVITKPATCTEDGVKTYTNKNDPSQTRTEVIKASGEHEWGKWKLSKKATCEEDGEAVRTCAKCGEKETKKLAKTGHDWDEGKITKEPTCKDKGIKTFTCKNDPKHAKSVEIEALGHKWGEWKVVKEATTTEEGSQTRTCERCKETQTVAIPKKNTETSISYSLVGGDGISWEKSSGKWLYFKYARSTDPNSIKDHFKGIQVDGFNLPTANYAISTSDSIIIGLKPEYLGSLSVGEHTVQPFFDDGTGTAARFTVLLQGGATVDPQYANSVTPAKTNDTSHMWIWIAVLGGGVAALVIFLIKRRQNSEYYEE